MRRTSLYFLKKWDNAAYGAIIIVIIRTAIKLIDFENTRAFNEEAEWHFKVIYQFAATFVHITTFLACYPPTIIHIILTMIFFVLLNLALFCGIYTSELMIQDPITFIHKSLGNMGVILFS